MTAKAGPLVTLEAWARRRRARLLRSVIARIDARTPLRILDVGGTAAFWEAIGVDTLRPVEITLLNLEPAANERLPSVVGDARDLSAFADQSFDLVCAHSVIGHVGSLIDQAHMAEEIARVGRHYVVQTPNHYCVIDWRTYVPGFHWLPAAVQAWAFRHLRVGTTPRAATEADAWRLATRIRNLTRRELAGLFPGARIYRERILGHTKSFTIVGEADSRRRRGRM